MLYRLPESFTSLAQDVAENDLFVSDSWTALQRKCVRCMC